MELFLLFQNQLPEPMAGWGGGEGYHYIEKKVSGELPAADIRQLPLEPTKMQWTSPTTLNPTPASKGDREGEGWLYP